MRFKFPRLRSRYRSLLAYREELHKQIATSAGFTGQGADLGADVYVREGITTPLLLAAIDEEADEFERVFRMGDWLQKISEKWPEYEDQVALALQEYKLSAGRKSMDRWQVWLVVGEALIALALGFYAIGG